MHNVNVNFSRTDSRSVNQYAFVEDVAEAPALRGVATDPFDWGVPQLSFSSLSSVRDMTPSTAHRSALHARIRVDAAGRHEAPMRIGGDIRFDESDNQTDANARGAFVFTGLYSSGGIVGRARRRPRLRRLPARHAATGDGPVRAGQRPHVRQVAERVWQDDWRKSGTLTLNLGVRYELMWPFSNGRADGEPRRDT